MTNPYGARLRELLHRNAACLLPGAANAITARIIESVGFEAAFVTGAGIANSYLGAPDIGLTTSTEVAAHVDAMREATSIPLIVDADTGFGNAVNTTRTVRMFERAGASCIMLEDQTFPKRCGHFEGKGVVPLAEMIQKIKAAVDARHSDDTLILARTDARATEGLSSAIERAGAYHEAGADLLFIEAPTSLEELGAIPRQVDAPHLCNMVFGGKTPLLERGHLAELGYAGVIYANAPLQASMLAMQMVLTHLLESGSMAGCNDSLLSFADRQKLVDFERFDDLSKRYATENASM
jgi:2-methylisocitrate lyase-like PEP mutase family enzyme